VCERVAAKACAVRRAPILQPTTRILAAAAAATAAVAGRYTSDLQMIWLPERQRKIHPKPDTAVLRDTIRLTFLKPIQPEDFFLGKSISMSSSYICRQPTLCAS